MIWLRLRTSDRWHQENPATGLPYCVKQNRNYAVIHRKNEAVETHEGDLPPEGEEKACKLCWNATHDLQLIYQKRGEIRRQRPLRAIYKHKKL